MKRAVIACAIGLTVLIPKGALAASCDVQEELTRVLAARSTDDSHPTLFLGLDHRAKRWAAFRIDWSDNTPKLTAEPFKLQLNNVPRLSVKGRDLPAVGVLNTNVMLYSVRSQDAEERDVEDLADLQRFAGLLGGALQAFVETRAQVKLVQSPVPSVRVGVVPYTFEPKGRGLPAVALGSAQPQAAIDRMTKRNEPRQANVRESLKGLRAAVLALKTHADKISARSEHVRPYLQHLEFATSVARLKDDGLPTDLLAKTEEQLESVEKAAAATTGSLAEMQCGATHQRIREAIDVAAPPTPPSDVPAGRRELFLAVTELTDDSILMGDGCDPAESQDVKALATALGSNTPSELGMGAELWGKWKGVREIAVSYESQAAAARAALAKVDDLLAKAGDLTAQAAHLEELARREALHSGPDTCALAAGTLLVDEPYMRLDWTKVRTGSFQVAADAPYGNQVVRGGTGDLTGRYELARARAFTFQVGFGLVYTPLAEQVWGAIDDPLASDTKVIVVTDEKTRAGQPTVFMTVAPSGLAEKLGAFGLDVGVGVARDQPSLFLGVSLAVGSFARVGGGLTYQRVKELGPGQIERMVRADGALDPRSLVTDDAAIRTRDTFAPSYYVSLVVTLKALPFFKPLE